MNGSVKIYFDHNVIVYLRNGSSEDTLLKVEAQKRAGCKFLFSPAHLEEIAVSQKRDGVGENIVDRDIDFLTDLCERNSIRPVSRERVELFTEFPRECYARVVDMYDRNDIAESMEKGFFSDVNEKFENNSKKINNLDPVSIFNETITNREMLLFSLRQAGLISQSEALECLQSWSFKTLNSKFAVREYMCNWLANWLEIIGYYREAESKSRSRMHDVSHIIYASYADVLVSNDAKLLKKTAAIYSILEMSTKVLKLDQYLVSE